jgi:uncharacterized cupin superfamily protein
MTLLDQEIRRIVTIDYDEGRSKSLSDGPITDIRTDPARPGYLSRHVWAAEAASPMASAQMAQTHHRIEPPPLGSVCRIITFPPDVAYAGKVGAAEVAAFFSTMGSPHASTYGPKAPHPYMQKTQTLDFCLILEGKITLVLDIQEVDLEAGDTVIQRGTNHAWSNRSTEPCTIAFTLIDANYET